MVWGLEGERGEAMVGGREGKGGGKYLSYHQL